MFLVLKLNKSTLFAYKQVSTGNLLGETELCAENLIWLDNYTG